jgi:hypothetical protein
MIISITLIEGMAMNETTVTTRKNLLQGIDGRDYVDASVLRTLLSSYAGDYADRLLDAKLYGTEESQGVRMAQLQTIQELSVTVFGFTGNINNP